LLQESPLGAPLGAHQTLISFISGCGQYFLTKRDVYRNPLYIYMITYNVDREASSVNWMLFTA